MGQPKTSLEKSHSAWSNAKLTFLCIETIVVHSGFWCCLGASVYNIIPTAIGTIGCFCLGCITILNLILFNKFKR